MKNSIDLKLIKKKIANGRIKETLEDLLNHSDKITLIQERELLAINSKFSVLQKQFIAEKITLEEQKISLNKIIEELLIKIDEYFLIQLKDEVFADQTNVYDNSKIIYEAIVDVINKLHEIQQTEQIKLILGLESQIQDCKKKIKNNVFQVGILAPTNSGKTTIINALLGKNYLPISDEPETKKNIRIKHNPDAKKGKLIENKTTLIEGVRKIHEHIKKENESVSSENILHQKLDCFLEVPIKFLEDVYDSDQNFELIDTPGPNAAELKELNEIYKKLCKEVDVILFVIPYKEIAIAETQERLYNLLYTRNTSNRKNSPFIYILINKIDEIKDFEERFRKTKSSTIASILNAPGNLKIDGELIFSISGLEALNSRIALNTDSSFSLLRDSSEIIMQKLLNRKEQILSELPNFRLDFNKVQFDDGITSKSNLIRIINVYANYLLNNSGFLALENKLRLIYKQKSLMFLGNRIREVNQLERIIESDLIQKLDICNASKTKLKNNVSKKTYKQLQIEKLLTENNKFIENYKLKVEKLIDSNSQKLINDSFILINKFSSGLPSSSSKAEARDLTYHYNINFREKIILLFTKFTLKINKSLQNQKENLKSAFSKLEKLIDEEFRIVLKTDYRIKLDNVDFRIEEFSFSAYGVSVLKADYCLTTSKYGNEYYKPDYFYEKQETFINDWTYQTNDELERVKKILLSKKLNEMIGIVKMHSTDISKILLGHNNRLSFDLEEIENKIKELEQQELSLKKALTKVKSIFNNLGLIAKKLEK